MRGLTLQPCARILFIDGLYLSPFICMAWSSNLSSVKVNSLVWMVRSGVGIIGPFCSYMTPVYNTWS